MYARLALNLIKSNPLPPSLECYTTNLDLWHPKFLQPVQWTPKLFSLGVKLCPMSHF